MVYWQLISHTGCFTRGGGGGVLGAKNKGFYVLPNINRFGASLYHEAVKTYACYSITLHVPKIVVLVVGEGGGTPVEVLEYYRKTVFWLSQPPFDSVPFLYFLFFCQLE